MKNQNSAIFQLSTQQECNTQARSVQHLKYHLWKAQKNTETKTDNSWDIWLDGDRSQKQYYISPENWYDKKQAEALLPCQW